MRYLPHTQEDIQQMLQVVGATDLDALFSSIPDDCRRKEAMDLPEPLTEWELNGHMDCMAASIGAPPFYKVFMALAATTILSPKSPVSCCCAASTSLPTRPTNRKSAREPFRPSTSTRPW
jgi:hypothetical protein